MATVAGQMIVQMRANADALISQLNAVEKRFQKVGKSISAIGVKLTTALTLPIAGMAAAVATTAFRFEKAMNRVAALTGATGASFQALQSTALDLGKTTQFSASEAADAMGFLAQAGFNADQIISAMPATLNLAAAGMIDLGTAADIVSDVMTGFGKSADELNEVADILTNTFTKSNTNLIALGESMKFVAPVAAAAGLELAEVSAAIGLLGKAGLRGSIAGTGLRRTITDLLNPTQQMKQAAEDLGVEIFSADGEIQSITHVISELEGAGASAADVMKIFGTIAGTSVQALLAQGADALEEFTDEVQTQGAANSVATRQMQGLVGAFKSFMSAAENMFLVFGEQTGFISILTNIVNWLTQMARSFAALDPATKKVIGVVLALLAALGPGLFIFGKLISLMGIIVGIFGLILSPVGALVAGIVLLVLAFKNLMATNSQFAAVFGELWNTISVFASKVISAITKGFSGFGGTLSSVTGPLSSLVSMITVMAARFGLWLRDIATAPGFLTTITNVVGTFVGFAVTGFKMLSDFWKRNSDTIMSVGMTVWGKLSSFIKTLFNSIVNFLGDFLPNIGNLFKSGASVIFKIFRNIAETIMLIWEEHGETILSVWSANWDVFTSVIETALNLILNFINFWIKNTTKAFDVISALLDGDWAGAWKAYTEIIDNVLGLFGTNLEEMKQGVMSIMDSVVAVMDTAASKIKAVWDGIAAVIKGAINIIIKAINIFIDGINSIAIPAIKIPGTDVGFGGFSFNVGKIPELARGGIIKKDGIFRAGEGNKAEAVVPLERGNPFMELARILGTNIPGFAKGGTTGKVAPPDDLSGEETLQLALEMAKSGVVPSIEKLEAKGAEFVDAMRGITAAMNANQVALSSEQLVTGSRGLAKIFQEVIKGKGQLDFSDIRNSLKFIAPNLGPELAEKIVASYEKRLAKMPFTDTLASIANRKAAIEGAMTAIIQAEQQLGGASVLEGQIQNLSQGFLNTLESTKPLNVALMERKLNLDRVNQATMNSVPLQLMNNEQTAKMNSNLIQINNQTAGFNASLNGSTQSLNMLKGGVGSLNQSIESTAQTASRFASLVQPVVSDEPALMTSLGISSQAGPARGGVVINMNVEGTVKSEKDLVDAVRAGLTGAKLLSLPRGA